MEHNFCRILCASLRLLLFYTCFCSSLINTRLVSISYFVSVPLRKGHRGLEYQCSFVRLYLFLFAFLIIRIETSYIFLLFVLRLLVFRRYFITLPPSFGKTGPQSEIQDSGGSEEQHRKIICKRYSIQFLLNIRPNYNYLHKMIYIYIYIYIYICVKTNGGESKDCH